MAVDNWVMPLIPFAGPGSGGETKNRFRISMYSRPYWKDME